MVCVSYLDNSCRVAAEILAQKLQLKIIDYASIREGVALVVTLERLELHQLGKGAPGPIYVDFLSGVAAHRHRFGGGKNQLIAKAVGLQRYPNPTLLDITAGLGRDAFVLATLGCDVTMLERSPVIAALLQDGITRAHHENWFTTLKFSFIQTSAENFFTQLNVDRYPDVIYFDPMYPDSKKAALVKKEMRLLRSVVGDDEDAANVLALALPFAKRRVVVKRSRLAENIAGFKPDLVVLGKSSRYDIYLKKR